MKFINREEKIAWLAGLIEGEGHFCNHSGSQRFEIGSTDEDVISQVVLILAELTGKTINALVHPGKRANERDLFVARLYGEHARTIMKLVIRFMSEHRKHQIVAALQGKKLLKKVDLHSLSLGGLTPLKPPKVETVSL